jgi:hypothetical protein
MFCDQCGAHLQTGQAHCVRCGKSVTGTIEYGRNRVREHVKLVGILWMAYSALHLLGGLVVLLIGKLVIVRMANIPNGPPPEVMEWLPALVTTVGWLIVVNAGLGVAVGWALLQHQDWARTFALVLGFFVLLNVPIGTTLGIYTLWVLLPSQSEAEYREMAAAA